MTREYLLVVAVLVGASGCARSTPPALAEVIFRRELAKLPQEFVPCLSVDGKDANTELLEGIRKLRADVALGSECVYEFGGSYHRTSRRKAMLMNVTRTSSTEVQYIGKHSGKWADIIRLEVRKELDGWKVLRVVNHEAA